MKINYDELVNFDNIEFEGDTSQIDEILEYEDILFEISKALIEYRKENKLTQKQLAKVLNVNQVMISKLESGNYNPTFKQIHKISRKLTNSVDFFVKVLNAILDNMKQRYYVSYDIKISEDMSKDNIIYYKSKNYKDVYKGGNYETKECSSKFSNVG